MPVIRVSWWAGRPDDDRVAVAKGITEVMAGVGIPAAATHVIFEDVPKDHWATGGVLHAEPPKE